MTLEPGDIISTGTPSGTALSMSSNLKYLKNNDLVEVELEKLGKIKSFIFKRYIRYEYKIIIYILTLFRVTLNQLSFDLW